MFKVIFDKDQGNPTRVTSSDDLWKNKTINEIRALKLPHGVMGGEQSFS